MIKVFPRRIRMKELTTERLVLRSFRADDLDAVHELMSDPELCRDAGFNPSGSAEETMVRFCGFLTGPYAWAVTVKGSDVPVGWVRMRDDDIRKTRRSAQAGYAIAAGYREKGYMTEALKAACSFMFEETTCDVISAKVFPENTASVKVLEKSGFTREGVLRRAVMLPDRTMGDFVSYSLLKEDFSESYELLPAKLKALADPSDGWLTSLCNGVSLIFNELPLVNWAGVYFYEDGALKLGPFNGKPACTLLTLDKGVCAKSARDRATVVVDDVHLFEGHIACDSDSESEIVIPLIKDGTLLGVLDIDSPVKRRFSANDRLILEKTAQVLTDIVNGKLQEEK